MDKEARKNEIEKVRKIRHSMAWHMNGGILILLVIYGLLIAAVGFVCIINNLKKQYEYNTYDMSYSASFAIVGDNIEKYLAGEEQAEYQETKKFLDSYCHNMSATTIYVIKPDTTDYGSITCIFDSVDNTVDETSYTEWELGYVQDPVNERYREKYKAVFEGDLEYETTYRFFKISTPHPHITTIVPVYDSNNNVVALLCMQRPMKELSNAVLPYVITIIVFSIIITILACFIAGKYNRKHFVEPIKKISDESVRFAKENTQGEPLDSVSGIEEIANLAMSINTMESDTIRYIENLTTITAEKERMGTELAVAKSIQSNSIPSEFPAFPDRKEFDIYASMTPAREVGGDFYNFLMIDEDHLAVLIGDVSGKGVPAALFMMMANILLVNTTQAGGTPADILENVNKAICSNNKEDMFVTCWLGILELSSGKIIASNAGHEYPAVMSNGRFKILKDKHGFVVGGMEGVKYTNYNLILEPGDKLFLYSDGVPEATNTNDELLGMDRMLDILNRNPSATPKNILENVWQGVNEFVQDAEQFDDLTMVCLEYKGITK